MIDKKEKLKIEFQSKIIKVNDNIKNDDFDESNNNNKDNVTIVVIYIISLQFQKEL